MKLFIEGKQVKIPKYIIEAFHNEYERYAYIDYNNEDVKNYGYIVRVYKKSPQTTWVTHYNLCERIAAWCRKNGAAAEIVFYPDKTKYEWQTIAIYISDPVLRYLEALNLVVYTDFGCRNAEGSGYKEANERWEYIVEPIKRYDTNQTKYMLMNKASGWLYKEKEFLTWREAEEYFESHAFEIIDYMENLEEK